MDSFRPGVRQHMLPRLGQPRGHPPHTVTQTILGPPEAWVRVCSRQGGDDRGAERASIHDE